MNKIYSLKYNNLQTLFSDKFIKNNADNTTEFDIAIDDFINSDYDIVLNKMIVLSSKENKIYLYILSSDVKILCGIFDKDNAELTQIGEEHFGNIDKFKKSLLEIYSGILFVSTFIKNFNKLEKTRQIKTIKGEFNTKYKIKDSKIEVIKYEETENVDYIINKDKNRVDFIVNNYRKTILTVPSKLYSLPNTNEIFTFSKDNTFELENEDISKALSNISFLPGECYKNSEKIVNALKEEGLDYKVEFYSGWIYNLGHMTHHSWVVINDKHLLDVTFFREDNLQKEYIEKSAKGELYEVNRDITSTNIANLMKSNKEFKDKYGYGKVIHDFLYIGVKSNRDETRESVNSLRRKNSDHPSFKNTDSRGRTKTINMIYDKIR